MVEHGVCIRAVPNRWNKILEAQHINEYPDGKIVFLPEYKREMLVVDTVPKCAGKFLVKTGLGTGAGVNFTGGEFYDSLEEVVDAIMGKA